MKRIIPIVLGVLAVAAGAFAQTDADMIARALAAAPAQQKDNATVVKWKADGTYDTIKKGTNRLVCYDRSGEPGRAAFAVQCTSIGNLERVAQNRKFEAMLDKAARQAADRRRGSQRHSREAGIRSGLVHDERYRPGHRSPAHYGCRTRSHRGVHRTAG